MIATQRQEHEETPRVMARGHLVLLDWERPSGEAMTATSIKHAEPIRRAPFDRALNTGLLLLVVTTVGAVCACMAHL